jgi:hypothetical protein
MLIHMRDYYDRKRLQLLDKYANSDSPDHRLELANALSHLEQRWAAIHKMFANQLFSVDMGLQQTFKRTR